jgi:hypothetical protein
MGADSKCSSFLFLKPAAVNGNTTTVAYTATKDNPPVFISLF